jgi:hypothetical protein
LRLKGVCYDVGAVMGFNWRPSFDPEIVRRELEIIRKDLHCNAVRISGLDIGRLTTSARMALDEGLEVWLSPLLWEKSPQNTLEYIKRASVAAEGLRQHSPDKVVLSVGSELTLFMQGIIPGRNLTSRMTNPGLFTTIKTGSHNKPLNEFLVKAAATAREMFHGPLIYASLVWEGVDWSLFDYVGVDHYRITKIEDRYVEMLKPSFDLGKPVVITEFGYATCNTGLGSEGFLSSAGLGGNIIDNKSLYLHYKLPFVGRFFHPRLIGDHVRDEGWQARKLVEQLTILEEVGVEGTFVSDFVSQIKPYNSDPKHDLDMASSSLVRSFEGGEKGTTYPDMHWEPKESFRAVAEFYASR